MLSALQLHVASPFLKDARQRLLQIAQTHLQ
jgi:hypothetical protein